MSYQYEAERYKLFTDEGQRMFIKIRDKAKKLLSDGGAFMMQHVVSGITGESWTMLACVDRLVELGEIKELTAQGRVAGQRRVFICA
jgi:hypothetical protein